MIDGGGRFFLNTFGVAVGTGVDDREFLVEGGAEDLALFNLSVVANIDCRGASDEMGGRRSRRVNERDCRVRRKESSSVPLFSKNEICPSSLLRRLFPFRHYSRSKLRSLPGPLDQIVRTLTVERIRDRLRLRLRERGGD